MKIFESVANQKYRIYSILDSYYLKTLAVIKKSQINFGKEFLSYVNDDPFQKVEPVLSLLLNGILKNMISYIEIEKSLDEKKIKVKFAILIKLILLTYDIGIFESVPKDLEYNQVYKEIEKLDNYKAIYGHYENIVIKGN